MYKLRMIAGKSDFAKNTFILTSGTFIAQLFPILFYPILGRIFNPSEFGLFAILASISALLTVISTGRYESSILIAASKTDAANIIVLVLTISFAFLSISLLAISIFSTNIGIWFNNPSLSQWIFICPISAFSIIVFNCYNEWCVRNKYFLKLAGNKIINASSTTIGKLFFGLSKFSGNGLVVGDLLGRILTAIISIYGALKSDKDAFSKISRYKMKELLKRYVEFPKFMLPGQILNTLAGQLPIFFIGIYFNSTEVGYFAMTMNVIGVPSSIISLAIRDIFRQRANEDYIKTGNCRHIFYKTLIILSLMALLGSTIVFFILPDLFSVLLGENWRISGEYSQIILPMVAIGFISNSLNGVLIITEKIRIGFFFQVYFIVIILLSLGLGIIVFQSMKMTLILFALGKASAYLLEIYLSYKYSNR